MEIINEVFLGYGVVGIIGGICFKNVLDRLNQSEARIENKEAEHKQEIKELTQVYRDELKQDREEMHKDRETYIASMNILSIELREVKNDVKSIKDKVGV